MHSYQKTIDKYTTINKTQQAGINNQSQHVVAHNFPAVLRFAFLVFIFFLHRYTGISFCNCLR